MFSFGEKQNFYEHLERWRKSYLPPSKASILNHGTYPFGGPKILPTRSAYQAPIWVWKIKAIEMIIAILGPSSPKAVMATARESAKWRIAYPNTNATPFSRLKNSFAITVANRKLKP